MGAGDNFLRIQNLFYSLSKLSKFVEVVEIFLNFVDFVEDTEVFDNKCSRSLKLTLDVDRSCSELFGSLWRRETTKINQNKQFQNRQNFK